MKKLILIILIAFIIQTEVSSQSCLPNGINFTTQTQIDSFQISFPNCTEIGGNVTINGDDIDNLYGLNVLTSIDGDLNIGSPYFGSNNLLSNFYGLDSINNIGGSLIVIHNNSITNLEGLGNITSIGGNLQIESNELLNSVYGINSITSIGGNIELRFNLYLTDLSGLSSINSVGGGIEINYNWFLTNLWGLSNINSIGGDLIINENLGLINLGGLNSINSVDGEIIIRFNTALNNIYGIENIDAASIEHLEISFNSQLSTCEINSICDYLINQNGSAFIYSNLTGCNSKQEIEEECTVSVPVLNTKLNHFIYPNPAKNEVFIAREDMTNLIEVTIYNQLGQIKLHQNFTTSKIDISKLEQGIYIIELTSNELTFREKLVIKK